MLRSTALAWRARTVRSFQGILGPAYPTTKTPAFGSAWMVTSGMASSALFATNQLAQLERIGLFASTVRQGQASAPTAPTVHPMRLTLAVAISATPAIIPATSAFSGLETCAFAALHQNAAQEFTGGRVLPALTRPA
jgi:hypothetical protein